MRRPRRSQARWLALALGLALACRAPSLGAAEVTDVASSGDRDHPFGANLRIGYDYLTKVAAVKREHEGEANQAAVVLQRDLVYRQTQHRMNLRAEVGLYHDLSFSLELPLVLFDSRTLEYDQRAGGGCTYGGPAASCVNADTSLTTSNQKTFDHADWNTQSPDYSNPNYLVPFGGYDALASTDKKPVGFAPSSGLVFQGPHRGGSGSDLLDTVNLGLNWAPMSQRRDDTKPTWLLSLEYRVSVGNVMAFDRAHPDASHGVSDGLDRLVLRTAISHRFRYLDPYALFWFDYPFVRRSDTLFYDLGGSGRAAAPQIAAGTRFGVEVVPYDRPREQLKLAIDVNLRLSARFNGRGYSEIWEMLASSPALACDDSHFDYNPSCSPKAIDPATKMPWNGTTSYQGKPFSGITTIDNYGTLGGEIALAFDATRWARLRAAFLYSRDQGHLVTSDDVGQPAGGGARVAAPSEYNPAYRPVINQIGRRYQVDEVDVFQFSLRAQLRY